MGKDPAPSSLPYRADGFLALTTVTRRAFRSPRGALRLWLWRGGERRRAGVRPDCSVPRPPPAVMLGGEYRCLVELCGVREFPSGGEGREEQSRVLTRGGEPPHLWPPRRGGVWGGGALVWWGSALA